MEYLQLSPDEVFVKIIERLHWEENKGMCKRVSIVALLTCFFNYFYFMVNGYGGPDAICEGVYYYIGKNTATRLARWFIPFITSFFGKNVIIPFVIIIFYCTMIAVSAMLIFKLWNIKNIGFQILTVSAMVCFPVVTLQFAYLYMSLAYSVAFLMTVLALYFLRKNNVSCFMIGTACLVLMFGSFQSYIASAAVLVLMTFLLDLSKGRKLKESFRFVGGYVLSGFIAGVIDLGIADLMMNYREVEASGRVSEVSISDILENLDFSLRASYRWFFIYFESDVLSRNRLYMVLFVTLVLLVVLRVVIFLKTRNILNSFLLVAGTMLIPLAMNVCAVIFPHNGIYDVMRYQYVLLIPFTFALFSSIPWKMISAMMQWILYVTIFLLIMGYTITSNASAICYKLAYESTYTQAVSMLSEIYELEEYEINSTPIVLGGGSIGYADSYVAFNQLFRYAAIGAGPIFWSGEYGLTTCRYYYFLDYLGVNPGWLTNEQYRYVIGTEEYENMPCWPKPGSVKMIDGFAVIKIDE